MAHDLEKKWRSEDVQLQDNVDFSTLILSDRVLYGLKKAGFKKPSPIQLEAVPLSKIGKDLLVQAKSGTGKTLVFVLTALEMLRRKLFRPQVMILVPTREIATQICSVIKSVGSGFPKLTCNSFIGGLSVTDDIENARTCQIVVGTPGRLNQLVIEKILPTNAIRLLVFDEADQLLQMSFKNDINAIFKSLPEDKQVIATSATYPEKLKKLLLKYLREPHVACLNSREIALLAIVHYAKVVKSSPMPVMQYKFKLSVLEEILKAVKFSQCLVFCNGIQRVEVLYRDIKKWGFSVAYISSAKEQYDRLKAIDRLKHFKCKVLVSSDVTSRGIDAENVDLVINFDLAHSTETYMHRCGRAGRYGSIGVNISIVEEKQLVFLRRMEAEASFKTYKLPDPIPVDLIQNGSFGEYVFEESDSDELDLDQEPSTLDKVKIDVSVDKENHLNEKLSSESVENGLTCKHDTSFYDGDYALTKHSSTEKISDVCEIVASSCLSKAAVLELISSKTDTGNTLENIHSSMNENCQFKNVEVISNVPAKKDNVENMNEKFDDLNTEDVPRSFEPIVSSEKMADLNSQSMSCGKTNDNVDNERANHCLGENDIKILDEKLVASANEPVTQLFEQVYIQNSVQDADTRGLFKSDIYINDTLDRGDLNYVINTFLNEYDLSRSVRPSDPNREGKSEIAESSRERTISVCRVSDLNTKKYSYIYEVCKKYQEEKKKDCHASGEENIEKKLTVPFENEMCEQDNSSSKVICGDICLQTDVNHVSDSANKQNHIIPVEKSEPKSIPESSVISNCESTPQPNAKSKLNSTFKCADQSTCELAASSKLQLFEEISDSDSDSDDMELNEEVDLDVSQYPSSSEDSDEESSLDFSDSDSFSSEDSYHHNQFRTGKQNPSLVSSSASSDSDSEKRNNSKYEQGHKFSKFSHCDCLKSHQRIHCSCLKNYPQHPSYCPKSKGHNAYPRGAFRAQNHSGHMVSSSQHVIACGGSCFQPSGRRCHCDSFCNQMQMCSVWHRTFYSQWKHLQNCINSPMM